MRAKGDGSIYQRADGRWVAQVDAGHYPNGRRRFRRRVRATRRTAQQQLRRLQQIGDQSTDHLDHYLTTWLASLEGARAPKTIDAVDALTLLPRVSNRSAPSSGDNSPSITF